MATKKKSKIIIIFVILSISIFGLIAVSTIMHEPESSKPRIRSSSSPNSNVKSKVARQEYFHRLLRDPKTDQIPPRMRQSELEYAQKLKASQILRKKTAGNNIFWQFAGPVDVGGRTRALAVDITNANTLLAGGVSGGIWKSTDGGNTWTQKNTPVQPLSVTSLAQDTRSGYTNTWYYSTGELRGNSASDQARRAIFYGTGIYKSTNNGETWSLLESTNDINPHRWNVPSFDLVTRVYVSPTTGTVFTANNGSGIYRFYCEQRKWYLSIDEWW
jgi:flagellar basal body-associated protein FliL